ncbi:MAG: TonB-dependent receptor [bacterium]
MFKLLVILVVCCTELHAGFFGITGILEGRIRDKKSKELLIGATVLILATKQGGVTDVNGRYQINNIRAGIYEVRISMTGYAAQEVKKVTILPDLRTRIDAELEETSVEMKEVEIRAERPIIQRDLAATAFTFAEARLEKMPITEFRDVLTLQPGVTREGNVRGGRVTDVVYLVDGLPVQNLISGGLGASLPRSAITGLTIYTGGFDAEYGNALSGVVNVITKSAVDVPQFNLRYERDQNLPEAVSKQTDRAQEVELTGSGPLITDRLFGFIAATAARSDTRWWQEMQEFFRSPIRKEFSGFGKIEYAFSPFARLSLQVLYGLQEWRDYEFSWRFNLNGLPRRKKESSRLALLFNHTISNSSFYSLSVSWFNTQSRLGDGTKENVTYSPYEYDVYLRYIVKGNKSWWADIQQQTYSLKGDFTSQLFAQHLFKAGFELNQYNALGDLIKYEPQTNYFGKPVLFSEPLNFSNSYTYQPRSGNVFLQDKIQIVEDGSIITLGLRWDFFDPTAERPIVEFVPTAPKEYSQKIVGTARASLKQQISPRLSVAGPIGEEGFFFVNFGQYFQFPLFDYLYSGINPAQLKFGAKNVQAGNPDLEPERVMAWEVGFKQALRNGLVASVTYFQKQMKNQIDAKTLVPFDSRYAGDYGFATYVNNATAIARGVEFFLSREHNEILNGTLSYTYMMAEGLGEYVNQNMNLAQWGFPLVARPYPLSWDQRHTVKLDADMNLPLDVQANLIAQYNSARPYTYYPTRDGFNAADPSILFTPNNSRMKDASTVDLKLRREFQLGSPITSSLSLFIDIRNLFNSKNIRWVDSNGRIGGELGDPSAYYELRRVRLGVRMEF